MTTLTAYRAAVVAKIKVQFPDLKQVESHGGRFDLKELRRVSAKAPAVFVAIVGIPKTEHRSDGLLNADLSVVAYVITRSTKAEERDAAALRLSDQLLQFVLANKWGLTYLGDPKTLAVENIFSSEIDKKGVALWAVSWRQSVRLGELPAEPIPELPADLTIQHDGEEV